MKRSGEAREGANRRPPNSLAGSQRKFRRQLALDGATSCSRCGLQAPVALRQIASGLFEEHHLFGRQHDSELTVYVCSSCHAILSAAQLDDDVTLIEVPTTLERLVAIAGAFGSYLRDVGEALLTWSLRGRSMIDGLDRDFPEWRKKPWAK